MPHFSVSNPHGACGWSSTARCYVICRYSDDLTLWTTNEKKVPWNGAVSMRSRAGFWETWSISITQRHNRGVAADTHANVLGIIIICRFPLVQFLTYTRTNNCFSDIMCHLVDISHHSKIVFMSSTTPWRGVSRARTWIAAVWWWVILLSGISPDSSWHPAWRVESFVSNGRWIYR